MEDDIEPQDIPRLLSLAAEHDRVDIIQDLVVRSKELYKNDESGIDILNHCKETVSSMKTESGKKETENENNDSLPFIPPLHIAIASGSVHASTCLLRMGADPSIRPQIQASLMDTQQEEYKSLLKYHDLSAFELLTTINLAAGKKRGIQHAFFAEALRAIGSDDVSRLECLLKSGMRAGNEYEEYDDNDKEEKKNERTLLDWAIDMTEDESGNSCVLLLKSWGKPININDENHPQSRENVKNLQLSQDSPQMIQMKDLSRRIEESQSLEDSLEAMLKDLIQETNICQALVHGRRSESSESTSPLLKHVKMMKALKAQKEVELDQYQSLMMKTLYEERRLKHIFQKQYASLSLEKTSEWETKMEQYMSNAQLAHSTTFDNLDINNHQNGNVQIIQDLTSQLDSIETRVRTLRASLVDVSEENARVRAEVKKLGLSGAVRLANTLREELVDYELRVKEEKEKVELCQQRCQDWSFKINVMNGTELPQSLEHNEDEIEKVDIDQSTDKETYVIVNNGEELNEEQEEQEDYSDSEYEEYEEYSDDDTTSSGEYEEYTDDEEEYDEEEYSDEDEYTDDDEEYNEEEYNEEEFLEEEHSDEEEEYDTEEDKNIHVQSKPSLKIQNGQPQEIVVRQKSYFTLEIWDLLCRIVGFGKIAVKEVKKNNKTIGRQSKGVIIV